LQLRQPFWQTVENAAIIPVIALALEGFLVFHHPFL
jgi:hypothetical protein